MENQKYNVLTLAVLVTSFLLITAGNSVSAKTIDKNVTTDRNEIITAKLLIFEKGSRAQIASQPIQLSRTGGASRIKLQIGTVLEGFVLKFVSRKVSVDAKEKFLWLEATLLDSTEKTVAYLTATVPEEKLSVGVGFPHPKDPRQQLVFMIDTTTL